MFWLLLLLFPPTRFIKWLCFPPIYVLIGRRRGNDATPAVHLVGFRPNERALFGPWQCYPRSVFPFLLPCLLDSPVVFLVGSTSKTIRDAGPLCCFRLCALEFLSKEPASFTDSLAAVVTAFGGVGIMLLQQDRGGISRWRCCGKPPRGFALGVMRGVVPRVCFRSVLRSGCGLRTVIAHGNAIFSAVTVILVRLRCFGKLVIVNAVILGGLWCRSKRSIYAPLCKFLGTRIGNILHNDACQVIGIQKLLVFILEKL